MILLTFVAQDGLRLGVKTGAGVLDVRAAVEELGLSNIPVTPNTFFAAGLEALPALHSLVGREIQQWLMDEQTLKLGPAVLQPGKLLCVGQNYQRHAEESGLGIPTTPVLFSKFNNAIAAPGEPVPLPKNAEQYDYEVELVVVMGRRARYVSKEAALDYVLGYCTGNDISARDLQFRTAQWLLGKTLDKFAPVGPYLVTADEAGDPQNMPLRCWLNGDLRQNSNTSDMIFSVAEIVSYASQYMTLEPGDVIFTGTPEGVILGMKERVWMKPGDEVTVEVGSLGKLTNPLVAES